MSTADKALVARRTPLERLVDDDFASHGIEVWMKRDDLIHPLVPGNKLRKLKYNLAAARDQRFDTILTFGGAYSNHIYAAAMAARLLGFRAIGIIRGEEHLPLNPVLRAAVNAGMQIDYLDRESYREKNSDAVISDLRRRFGDFYLLPEGGSNPLAVRGSAEIIAEIDRPFDHIVCPVGTGGTLAGLIAGLGEGRTAIGIAVLKNAAYLEKDVQDLLDEACVANPAPWRIELDYHFGGYARVPSELREFVLRFNESHDFHVDPIYTGKMMYGLRDLIRKDAVARGTTIVALHTGGVPASHWAELM